MIGGNMRDDQWNWFVSEISKNKGSDTEVDKNAIVSFALDQGLDIKARMAKAKIVVEIEKAGLAEEFYNEFQEYFYIPIWEVAKCWKLSTAQINGLIEVGCIKEDPVLCHYKGRTGSFEADAFPLSILELDPEVLREEYERIYTDNVFRLRIETKTDRDLAVILEKLSLSFEITDNVSTHDHRNGEGRYSYFNIKPLAIDPMAINKINIENVKLKARFEEQESKMREMEEERRSMMSEINELIIENRQLKREQE